MAQTNTATHIWCTLYAPRREGQPFHFVWLDGRRFKRVASAFRLLPSDLPSVVALSAKRMRYATTAAAADADAALGIHEFLDGERLCRRLR